MVWLVDADPPDKDSGVWSVKMGMADVNPEPVHHAIVIPHQGASLCAFGKLRQSLSFSAFRRKSLKYFSVNLHQGLRLVGINVIVLASTFACGVINFESSVPALRGAMHKGVLFPIYIPHAVGLSLVMRWNTSSIVGIFGGFYGSRLFAAGYGEYTISSSSHSGFLFLTAILGTAEVFTANFCLQKAIHRHGMKSMLTICSVRDALKYIAIVTISTLVFDTGITLVRCLSPLTSWSDFSISWVTSWLAVLAGMVTITPALTHVLSWKPAPNLSSARKLVEIISFSVITVGLVVVMFLTDLQAVFHPLPYLLFPLIIIATFRFTRLGWTLIILLIACICSWASIRRKGALYRMAESPPVTSPKLMLQVELFVTTIGLVGIFLAAAVREKKILSKELRIINEELESTVNQRTEELIKANEELQESQKKAEYASHAKSDFLANMSHEIRTPIHGIMGMTSLLLESELSEDQRESLQSVKDCANLLLHIINSILDLAKIEAGRVEVESVPFSIRKLVESTMRMVQTRAQEKGLKLLSNVDTAVPDLLVGDYGKIQQCLLNLVGNALKFTHQGSVTVNITLGQIPIQGSGKCACDAEGHLCSMLSTDASTGLPPAQITDHRVICVSEISLDAKSNVGQCKPLPRRSLTLQRGSEDFSGKVYLAFEVRDTGIGISEDKLQNIFKPFTQAESSTSRVYGGTGLGLCIVKRFIELLNGTLWAQTELGSGSSFTFCIPLCYGSAEGGLQDVEAVTEDSCLLAQLPHLLFETYTTEADVGKHSLTESTVCKLVEPDGFMEQSKAVCGERNSSDCTSISRKKGYEELQSLRSVHQGRSSRLVDSSPKVSSRLSEDMPPQAEDVNGGNQPSLSVRGKKLHVLLAEDNIVNQKVASRQLERHGYTVSVVPDGLKAVQAALSNHDLYDLVLMDVQMPLMDGLEATTTIRREEHLRGWSRLPVLGLTAHAIQGYEQTCFSNGMDGYLGKPFDIKQLLDAIHRYLPF